MSQRGWLLPASAKPILATGAEAGMGPDYARSDFRGPARQHRLAGGRTNLSIGWPWLQIQAGVSNCLSVKKNRKISCFFHGYAALPAEVGVTDAGNGGRPRFRE